MVTGVRPLSFPSTNTRAPGGDDRTTSRPVWATTGGGGSTRGGRGTVFAISGTSVTSTAVLAAPPGDPIGRALGDAVDTGGGATRVPTLYPPAAPMTAPATSAAATGHKGR